MSTGTKHEPTTYILKLRATGKGPPAVIRLRRSLKYLLRVCGLRCVEVRPVIETGTIGPGDEAAPKAETADSQCAW